jgi:hypothetical protein
MYPVAGPSFRASYAAGSFLSTLMVVLSISLMYGIVRNIMAALSPPAPGEKRGTPFTKGFLIFNLSNLVISVVIKSLGTAYDKDYFTGILRVMWAVMLSWLIYFAWSSSLKLERTRRAMAAGAGLVATSRKSVKADRKMSAMAAKKSTASTNRSKYWQSLKSLTVLAGVATLGLGGLGVTYLIDTEEPFYPKTPAFAAASVLTEVVQFFSLSQFHQLY